MKTIILTALLSGLLLFSCEEEKEKQLVLAGTLINNTNCKDNFKSAPGNKITADSLSCIDYSYNKIKLTIKHINAGFNCCPEKLYCNISLVSDTIIIQEFEKSALCDCNCLYDLDIEISGVETKKYILKLIEPYCGNQEKLIFEIDLTRETEGLYCVTRKQYPWGIFSINN